MHARTYAVRIDHTALYVTDLDASRDPLVRNGEHMNRVLFLDVDGTLVDYHGELPASAADAVRAARAAGHLVFLCTGRARAEVQQELWDLGVDGLIGGNGNYIEHRGEVVLHNALSIATNERSSTGCTDTVTSSTWKPTRACSPANGSEPPPSPSWPATPRARGAPHRTTSRWPSTAWSSDTTSTATT